MSGYFRFVPVADSDETQIPPFFVNRQLSVAVAEPPDQPAAQPLEESNPSARVWQRRNPREAYPQKPPQPQLLRLPDLDSPGRPKTPKRRSGSGSGLFSPDFPLGLEQPSIRDLSETNALKLSCLWR